VEWSEPHAIDLFCTLDSGLQPSPLISKGLHRYDTFVKDAGDCQPCKEIWTQMKKADEEQLHRLMPHLKQHIDRDEAARKAA
jgi:hypothetical protein